MFNYDLLEQELQTQKTNNENYDKNKNKDKDMQAKKSHIENTVTASSTKPHDNDYEKDFREYLKLTNPHLLSTNSDTLPWNNSNITSGFEDWKNRSQMKKDISLWLEDKKDIQDFNIPNENTKDILVALKAGNWDIAKPILQIELGKNVPKNTLSRFLTKGIEGDVKNLFLGISSFLQTKNILAFAGFAGVEKNKVINPNKFTNLIYALSDSIEDPENGLRKIPLVLSDMVSDVSGLIKEKGLISALNAKVDSRDISNDSVGECLTGYNLLIDASKNFNKRMNIGEKFTEDGNEQIS